MFTGRVVAEGEPLFLADDTAKAVALAEEERDTCPACGMPKAWCRDPVNQFGAFEPVEDFCWASYRLSDHRRAKVEQMGESQRDALQLSVRFREGREPDVDAGLDLSEQNDEQEHKP